MADIYPPPASFQERAYFKSLEQYQTDYERSIQDPEAYWAEKAGEFHWYKKWDTIRSYNYNMDQGPISIKWFEGGKTNVVYNCLDRHLETRADQAAIIWEGNEPGEDGSLTYRELYEQV